MRYLKLFIVLFGVNLVVAQDGIIFPDDERLSDLPTASRSSNKQSVARLKGQISREKCEEYKNLTLETEYFRGLSLLASILETRQTKCDAFSGLIVGGSDAKENQFPHMAAIGYPGSGGSVSFGCGGSLISEYFVLTAAHCNATFDKKPTFVRLGEHDLSKTSGNERDYLIDKFIQHPKYNITQRKNDIALIKLKTPVEFNKTYIFPACLDQNDFQKEKAIATGWGYQTYKGNAADVLQKVLLDILPCKNDATPIYKSQICAGVKSTAENETEKDTCEGDSGGPIQVTTAGNDCVYDIVGIVSFGSKNCGSEPGVYTRVASYIGWIESVVWPK